LQGAKKKAALPMVEGRPLRVELKIAERGESLFLYAALV
jgi:hypothetical protein